MATTLAELARLLGATLIGDGAREVVGVRPLDQAGPEHLSFLHNPRYVAQARGSRAGAILVEDAELLPGRTVLVTPQPYLATARALEILHPRPRPEAGVHPSAVVAADVELGEGAAVGPHVSVASGSRIGPRTAVGAGCVIGRQVEVGADTVLHPRVVIEDGCRVGDRCVLQPGVVIGGDGFGFATVGGVHHKVPQVGIVVVEDDVELGANVCVDRATLGVTRIGRGTKIDNLVQVAHNVEVGEGSILVAQVGIAGSTRLGHHVMMGGQSGAAGHLTLGDGAQVDAKAAVYKSVPAGVRVGGIPAREHREWLRDSANLRRFESLRERLAVVERELEALQRRGREPRHDEGEG